jgi:hypothetical protein
MNSAEGRVFIDGNSSIEYFSIEIVLREVEKCQFYKVRQRWSEEALNE